MSEAREDVTITIDEAPDPELRQAILAPLRRYNAGFIGEVTVAPVAIVLREPQTGEIVGGLWGHSAAGWLFIDLLFVPETLRRQGLGTALMRDAERIAIKRGNTGLWLSTGSFQAPGFYEKLGYTCFGVHPDYPKGYSSVYFSKRIETDQRGR